MFRLGALLALPVLLAGCGASPTANVVSAGDTAQNTPSASPLATTTATAPSGSAATCTPTRMSLSLVWHKTANGLLSGEVRASNSDVKVCGLPDRPRVRPIGTDGQPLAIEFGEPADQRIDTLQLQPGHTATSGVTWAGWCGKPAGHLVKISWDAAAETPATVVATGPQQPRCPTDKNPAMNFSST